MKARTWLTSACLLLVATGAQAIAPESGMYWQPDRSGRAFYIEHQKGRVGVAIYAFDRETGAAEVYVSGGVLDTSATEPDLHSYSADLFEASHGPPLTFPDRTGEPAITEKVGRIMLTFAVTGDVEFNLSLDDGGSDEGRLERFVFGYVRYAYEPSLRVAVDLRGEWVFIDQSDPSQAPLRFRFSQQSPIDPPLQYTWLSTFEVTYIDPDRNARLVCGSIFGDGGSPPAPMKRPGCELFVGEELLFSANLGDVGLDRMQAFRGPLPMRSDDAPFRGDDTVIGLRVVMPPEPVEPPRAK